MVDVLHPSMHKVLAHAHSDVMQRSSASNCSKWPIMSSIENMYTLYIIDVYFVWYRIYSTCRSQFRFSATLQHGNSVTRITINHTDRSEIYGRQVVYTWVCVFDDKGLN